MSGVEQLLKALAIIAAKLNLSLSAPTRPLCKDQLCEQTTSTSAMNVLQKIIKRIIRAIAPFRPRHRGIPENLKAPFDEQSLAQGTNFTLITDLGSLDLLGEMSGVGGYRQIVADAKVVDLGGVICQVASLDTIIRSKEAANRSKDRATLPELKALRMIQQGEQEGRDD